MKFTHLSPENVSGVVRVEQASFSHPWSEAAFLGELSNPDAVYFCLETEGKTVGYIGMWNILGEGNITNVAVLPEYRNRGYGKQLIEKMKEYAIRHQMLFLTLEVRISNVKAISLYESCGFVPVGQRKKYYENSEDALLMSWNVNP